MPTLPSALTRGTIAGAGTFAGDWFLVEHAGGLFRISRYELMRALGRDGALSIIGPSGGQRMLEFYTGASPRFYMGVNSLVESGGDAGSNFILNVCADNGSYKFTALDINRASGNISLYQPIFLPGLGTTASAANATLDGFGQLLKSTSSEEYKTAIEPLESWRADRVIDGAVPIWYRSLAPADDPDWSWYGLTAEQMAEIDPRLVHWSYRPSDYEETPVYETVDGQTRQVGVDRRLKEGAVKVPDGVAYERLTVMLLDVARREKAKVATLQDEVATLQTALAALTARVDALEA